MSKATKGAKCCKCGEPLKHEKHKGYWCCNVGCSAAGLSQTPQE